MEELKNKNKTYFTCIFISIESLITPSRTPAPVTSSTPSVSDIVLIRHTSTPKPGETASRIILGDKNGAPPLSAIYEVSPPANMSSPTPSTITATDISTATTPTIAIERRGTGRAPTVRGQAAAARKKIASMQIRDDDSDDDNEQFKKLFSRKKSNKSKVTSPIPIKKSDDLSDISVNYPV